MPPSTPTAPDGAAHTVRTRTVLVRRAAVVLLAVFVAAGATGTLGVRRHEVRAAGAGLEVAVTHASVTRGSMDASIEVSARRRGGLGGRLTVALPAGYLGSFTGVDPVPAPAAEQVDGDLVRWHFAVTGEQARVRIGLRAAPGAAGRQRATVTVADAAGGQVELELATWVLP